tara:strand:- start:207 stop:1802 length:1596 start_codon:yes stop_codon:yes gene_type:complete
MNFIKKNFFVLFLSVYFLIGSVNSTNSGISFDENYEELNWKFHVSLIQEYYSKITSNESIDIEKLNSEAKGFVGYGIGFQIISQPIQFLLKKILIKNNELNSKGAKFLSKHFVVFLFFFISGIFFYLILRKIIDSDIFSSLGAIFYLTYPYLFGQSMFSPKDIPFLSVWLVCTYLSFNSIKNLILENAIKSKEILLISFLTAFLFSIRIAGILILIQYFVLFFLFLNNYKINIINFIRKLKFKILLLILSLIIFTYLLNPIFWIDPSFFIETIKINAGHFNNVGTNTFGRIMYSKDLPSTYLPIWFLVKIPLLIIIGIILIPFSEKKIFENKEKSIYYGCILITTFLIPLILILKKVHLYDEIRQVMFLVPFIFILGLVSIFIISKKFYIFATIIMIFFFVAENIKINPYQYVWFNLPSRLVDITNKFELEYQGISGREIAKYLSKKTDHNLCILANPLHSVRPFLNNTNFNCYDIWQKIDTNYDRPFLAVQNVRNIKKSLPFNCKEIFKSDFNLFLHKKKFITAKLLKCE